MTDSAATCGLCSTWSLILQQRSLSTGQLQGSKREWKYAGLPKARLTTGFRSLPPHSFGQSTSHYQAAHIQNVGKLSPPVTEEMQNHIAQGGDTADRALGPSAE